MRTKWYVQTFKYAILAFITFLVLYPMYIMILNSFKTRLEVAVSPLSLPKSFSLANYISVWERANFSDYFLNSVIVSGASVFLVILVSSLAGFYLSRFEFPWNPIILFFFMIGLMLPMKLAIIPLYMLMIKLHLVDTLYALVAIYVGGGIPFAVFIFYGFFRTLSKELENSARLDGCNDFQVYTRIVLPLMKPSISIVGIVNLVRVWNDFFYPLIFIRDDDYRTIPLGMLTLFGEFDTEWNLLFAGLTLSSLPLLIAFVFASKTFIDGLTTGAVK